MGWLATYKMKIYNDKNENDNNVLVGYKGAEETESAAYFCPYSPLTLQPMNSSSLPSWQILLNSLHMKYAVDMRYAEIGITSQDNIMKANAEMQESYPGEYVVIEYFDSKIMRFAYKLEFDNSEDQTFFLLKYS